MYVNAIKGKKKLLQKRPKSLYAHACFLLGLTRNVFKLNSFKEEHMLLAVVGFTAQGSRCINVREDMYVDTYVHELLHKLFPEKEEPWISHSTFILCGFINGDRENLINESRERSKEYKDALVT